MNDGETTARQGVNQMLTITLVLIYIENPQELVF
jgi:hypothetical protein